MTIKLIFSTVLLSLPAWTLAGGMQTPATSEVLRGQAGRTSPMPAPSAPASPTAEMGPVYGSAQFQPNGSDAWFFARPGRPLPAGSLIKTEADSYCLFFFSDGTKLRLGPQSNLRMAELSAGRTTMSLNSGRLEAWVKRRKNAEFRTETPLFTAALPEGIFAAGILGPTSATLDIFSGEPTVLDSLGTSQKVAPGQRMELSAKTGSSTPAPLPAGAARPEEPSPAGPAAAKSITIVPVAPLSPSTKAKPTKPPTSTVPTSEIGSVYGTAQFQPGGSDAWFFARPGQPLPAGSLLKTETDSYCLFSFSDGTKLRLGPQSSLRVAELSSGRTTISLGSGRLEAWVKKRKGAGFRIETPMPLFSATLHEGSFAAQILTPTSATLDIFTGDSTVMDSLGTSQLVLPGSRMEFDAKTGFSTTAVPTAETGPVYGTAQFQPGGSDAWFFARSGQPLPAGSLVKTETDSYCLFSFSDGTRLRLGPQSSLRVAELSSGRTTISLGSGRLEAWIKKRKGAGFRVETPMPLFSATLHEGSFAAQILTPTSAMLDIFTGDSTVMDSLGTSQLVLPGSRMEFNAKTGFSTTAPLHAPGKSADPDTNP